MQLFHLVLVLMICPLTQCLKTQLAGLHGLEVPWVATTHFGALSQWPPKYTVCSQHSLAAFSFMLVYKGPILLCKDHIPSFGAASLHVGLGVAKITILCCTHEIQSIFLLCYSCVHTCKPNVSYFVVAYIVIGFSESLGICSTLFPLIISCAHVLLNSLHQINPQDNLCTLQPKVFI